MGRIMDILVAPDIFKYINCLKCSSIAFGVQYYEKNHFANPSSYSKHFCLEI